MRSGHARDNSRDIQIHLSFVGVLPRHWSAVAAKIRFRDTSGLITASGGDDSERTD
jgi:hypothetical protein